MVMAVAMASIDHHFYTSEEIDRTLKQWHGLDALAEHITSPSSYDAARAAPTRGYFHRNTASEMRADIMRAHAHLHRYGLAWNVIDLRMRGFSIGSIARALHQRKSDVGAAYQSALDRMVSFLNG